MFSLLRGTIARKYSFRIEYSTIEILQRSFQFYASMFSDYANYLSLVSVGYVGEVSKRNRKIARKLNGTARFFDRIVLDGSSVIGEMRFGGNVGQFEACLWQSSQTRKKHTWQCWKSAPLVRETAGRDFAHVVVDTFLRNWVKCPYWHSFSA